MKHGEEIWDDFESSDKGEPTSLPIKSNRVTSEEEAKAKAIINWTVGFLLILQARYYISNAAMNLLIRFISIVLKVLRQSSLLVAQTGN